MEETKTMNDEPKNASSADTDRLGREVPADLESEACVLGSMIIDSEVIDIVVQILKSEYFHRPAHAIIYDVLLDMQDKRQPIDLVTIKEELTRRKLLEKIGGIDYIVALAEGVPGVSNVEYYANIVRDKALLRRLIRVSQEIITDIYDSTDEAQIVIDQAEKKIFEIAEQKIGNDVVGLKEMLDKTFKDLEDNEGKTITGLASGYLQLDEMLAGFQNSELIIVAARPSMGKTALLLNFAEHVSITDKKPIAFFSLEMARLQITQRLLSSYSQFNLRNLRRTAISPEDWTVLQSAAGQLYTAPFYIDDTSVLTPLQLRAKARRLKARFDIKAIFIDYMQLMSPSGRGSDKRYEQIGEISRSLKALARELDIPVIVAAQLNRGPTDRTEHTPRMSDLRESGSIEQDADVVMLLHNEDYYHRGDPDYVPENITRLIVEKQRNGPTGVVKLIFRPECTRFESAAPSFMDN
ncbi:MAG TPA: replicative DNA helicase [Phycisphaerae bacterium]|nr:replicative DNA helicase [Phycisphaerae bacterium]HPS52984.1 replicative DNA helicase [Phycisphaerae bacterium]